MLVIQQKLMKSDLHFEFVRVDLSVSIHILNLLIIKSKDRQENADFRREVDFD